MTTLPSDPQARRLRWFGGAMAAAALVGMLLAANVIYSQGVARDAAQAVLQQEAHGWMRALFSHLREVAGPPRIDQLQAFVDEGQPEGLRFAAFVHDSGVYAAGAPAAALAPEGLRHGEIVWVGDHVRFAVPSRAPRGRASRHLGDCRGRVRPAFVIEFEPRSYPRFVGDARRTLGLGVATGSLVVLLAASAFFSMRRRQALEQKAERERHLARLGEMSAVLAHEIRNPLASLKGHAQLLEEGLTEPAAQGKARRVVDEAMRIERITNDLLDFVREAPLDRVDIDLGALLREIVADVVPDGRATLDLPAEPLRAKIDPHRLRQAIENLVRNAAQAGPGMIELGASIEAGVALVRVRDHGPGIPTGQAEQIFEPFVTTRTRGTGLGLAIARRLVERHGGSVHAENHPQGGALFTITLPQQAG